MLIEDLPIPHLAQFMNRCYHETTWDDPIVWYGGDDFEAITHHWDDLVIRTLAEHDGMGIVSGRDGYTCCPTCPTYFFVTREFIDMAGGDFVCPLFGKEGTDVAWAKVLEPMGLVHWTPDLHWEHHHATRTPNNQWDTTFSRLQEAHMPGYGKPYQDWVLTRQENIRKALT